MIYRLILLLSAAIIALLGLGVSAFAMSQGATDQAIAFGWPSLGASLLLALLVPHSNSVKPSA